MVALFRVYIETFSLHDVLKWVILLWTVVVIDISVAISSFLGPLLTMVFYNNMWNKKLNKTQGKMKGYQKLRELPEWTNLIFVI